MTTREKVQMLTLQGKTAAEICKITGASRATVCRYRKQAGAEEKKLCAPTMRPGFWDEWERAVSVLLGNRKNTRLEP